MTFEFLSKKIAMADYLLPLASATALAAPSSIVSTGKKPASARILRPSSALVPVKRITSGTLRTSLPLSASTMPSATWSPRVMPPKILMNIAFTRIGGHQLVAVLHQLGLRAAADVQEVG